MTGILFKTGACNRHPSFNNRKLCEASGVMPLKEEYVAKLFIGSMDTNEKLKQIKIQKGEYARITIKPKLGFIWGLSIGEAKCYFYTKWIKKAIICAIY